LRQYTRSTPENDIIVRGEMSDLKACPDEFSVVLQMGILQEGRAGIENKEYGVVFSAKISYRRFLSGVEGGMKPSWEGGKGRNPACE